MLGRKEGPGENDLKLTPPLVKRHLDHALFVKSRRVVHQDVDSAECFASGRDCGAYLALVGDVAGNGDGATAVAAYVARAVGGIFGSRVNTDHRCAFARQSLGDAATDVCAGAGDQRYFSLQFHLSSVAKALDPGSGRR